MPSQTDSHNSRFGVKIYKTLKLAGSNFLLLALGMAILELTFGNWFLPYNPPHSGVVNRTLKFRQRLYEPASDIVYVRDQHGLRGVKEPLRDIQVVTLGGSTTNQLYITEGETWQDVIRSSAHLRIANAGVEGMSSTGHLIALREWLHRLPEFRPSIYLHYVGINDAGSLRSEGTDRSGTSSWTRSIRRRSAIAQASTNLWSLLRSPEVVNHRHISPPEWVNTEPVRAEIDSDRLDAFIESTYKPNLRSILDLHRSRGEKTVFVSQMLHPLLIVRRGSGMLVPDVEYALLALALPRVNAVGEALCREFSQVCRHIDLAGTLRFAPEDFYDAVHNTPHGSRKIGLFLAAELTRLGAQW